ncbi:MAG: peptidylprolyl isomerase [Polyangiales bacterium]
MLTCALACGACGKAADAPPDAVARGESKHGLTPDEAAAPLLVIGDTKVTVGDFAEQLADKSPYLRARYASPERRRELLDDLVKFELLAREAAQRGLDKTDEVQRTKQQLMVQRMMKAEFEDKVKLSDITDADIEAYYTAHPDEYNKPAQVRTSEIIHKDEAKARRVLKQVLDRPGDDALFRELARAGDDAPLAERAGDRQFFSRTRDRRDDDPEVPEPVATAAFALDKIGDVHPALVKTPLGFHVVKLTGKRKELARTLEQARRPIQHRLWRERREAAIDAFVKTLRSEANVQENWALLDQVELGLPENDPSKGSDAGPRKPERAAKRGSR